MYCPGCRRLVPWEAIGNRVATLTLVGGRGTGKTTLLTVTIARLETLFESREGLLLEPESETIRRRYRVLHHQALYGRARSSTNGGPSATKNRGHSPSPTVLDPRVPPQPLFFRLKRSDAGRMRSDRFLSIMDMPGEDWDLRLDALRRQHAELVRNARGLILTIDPTRLEAVRHGLGTRDQTTPDSQLPLELADELGRLISFFPERPARNALAIVLTKLDVWGPTLPRDCLLHQLARGVPSTMEGPGMDRIIDEEARAALQRWGQGLALNHAAADFPNHQFFAVSSLGDAARSNLGLATLPAPFLVERPAYWLLRRQSIVSRRTS